MHISSAKEKLIRKAARARLRAVPALNEQWKKNEAPIGERIVTGLGVLLTGVFLFVPAAALGAKAIAVGKIDWTFVLAAELASLAICIVLANWLLHDLSESQFLAVCSLLPVPDRELVNDRIGICGRGVAIAFIPTLGFFALFSWAMTRSWADAGMASALAAVQSAVHGAIAMIVATRFSRWCNGASLAGLIILGFIVVFGINWAQLQFGMPNIDFILRPVTMLLPTGWCLMCLIQGSFENSALGWCFLIPVALLIVAAFFAARKLQDGYRIAEFELLEGATARVRTEREFALPYVDEFDEFEWEDRPLTELRAEVRSRDFLTTNPEEGGIIERMFYDMLSDEERRSVDVLTGGENLNLTRHVTGVAWAISTLTVVAFTGDAWLLNWQGLSTIAFASWLGSLTLLRRPEASLLTDRTGLLCGTASLLPVDWPRFHRVVNLAAIVQCLFLLPLSLVISGVGLWALRGHLPWFEAIALGFKPLLVLVAMHQFWLQFLIPLDASADRVMSGTKQLCDSLLMILFGIGAVWLFFTGFTGIQGFIATGILFGSGWLHRRFYRWLIVKRHTELVVVPPDIDATSSFSR